MNALSKAVIDLGGKLPKGTVKGYFVSGNCIMLKGKNGDLPSFVCSADDFENYVNKIIDTTFDMLTGRIC